MTNGNSPKIASEIIDAILAYGDARADKDLVKGTASLKKSIELIRSALSVCADGGKGEAVAWVIPDIVGGEYSGMTITRSKPVAMRHNGRALIYADTAPRAECAPREALNPEDFGLPPYPTVEVSGPCVCGSWPGGQCLRCLVIPPRSDAEKDAALTKWATEISDWIENSESGITRVPRGALVALHAAILAANKEK